MKREILFRGKRIDTKEWVYGNYLEFNSKSGLKTYIILPNGTRIEVIPETVGEFTGLTDKNVVKIFEDDLLEDFKYPVVYEDGSFCATIEYDLIRCWLNSDNCNLETLEVIGNIHDNPELL